MVSAEEVISIVNLLMENHIPVWLTGGWGIDALLGKQTRPHKDLDVLMLMEHLQRLNQILADQGFILKEIWEENRWVMDADGHQIATAFVLWDSQGREFDAHALQLDDQGNGLPSWNAPQDFFFTSQDLAGVGTIEGYAVQCITPEAQVFCHMGYQLPDKHLLDMQLLGDRFSLALPKDFGAETGKIQ